MGQQSHVSPSIQARRALFGSSRSGTECSSVPEQEGDSHSVPTASYLKDLRTNKTRPIGSRPPPPSKFGSLRRTETETTTATAASNERPPLPQSNSMPAMIPQTMPHHRPGVAGRNSPFAGRPLARTPSASPSNLSKEEHVGKPGSSKLQNSVYMEQGTRRMEKQEAQSLRAALEDMDIAEEQKIHMDAQDEAAELVWKHRNPNSPFANPEAPYVNPDIKKDYTSHLEKGSYSRSHSRDSAPLASTRGSMSSSHRPSLDASPGKRTSLDNTPNVSETTVPRSSSTSGTSSGKNYGDLAAAVKKDIDTARRRTSSGSRRILSGEKKVFMHPDDKIFEDPQEEATPPKKQQPVIPIPDLRPVPSPIQTAPSLVRKNPFARVRMQQERLERLDRSQSAPVLPPSVTKMNRIEIQRNPPSQSRNAGYMSNESLPLTPTTPTPHSDDDVTTPQLSPMKDGKEIRGDDIRAATSKQRSARSPNLPQPTAVSDKLGRPIVSFDQSWKQQKEIVLEETRVPAAAPAPALAVSSTPPRTSRVSDSPRSSPFNRQAIPKIEPPRESVYRTSHVPTPTMNVSGRSSSPMPPIPTIVVPDDPSIPSIVLPEEPDIASAIPAFAAAPTINIEPPQMPVKRPSVSASGPSTMSRPPMRPARTAAPAIHFDPPSQPTRSAAPSISANGPGFSSRPIPSLPPSTASHRPLPTPTQQAPLYHHANTSPIPKSTPHYTPSLRQSKALCAHCALPIAGRVLSAAGQRLHPS